MPQRSNRKGDLGYTLPISDVVDQDNIYFTEEGWVYRHFKGDPSLDDTRYWDEILVAGAVDISDPDNEPVVPTVSADPRVNLGQKESPLKTGEIDFESVFGDDGTRVLIKVTDEKFDVAYSHNYGNDGNDGNDGTPPPPADDLLLGSVTLSQTTSGSVLVGDTRTYEAELSGGNVDTSTLSGVLTIEPGVSGTDWIINEAEVEYLKEGTYTLTVEVQTTETVVDNNPTSDTLQVIVEPLPIHSLGTVGITPKTSDIDEGESVTFSYVHENSTVTDTPNKVLIVESDGNDYTINDDTVTFGVGDKSAESYTVKWEFSSTDPYVDTTPIYSDEATVSVSEISSGDSDVDIKTIEKNPNNVGDDTFCPSQYNSASNYNEWIGNCRSLRMTRFKGKSIDQIQAPEGSTLTFKKEDGTTICVLTLIGKTFANPGFEVNKDLTDQIIAGGKWPLNTDIYITSDGIS